MPITRRHLPLLASALSLPAQAQAATVRQVAMPCPSRPGEFLGMVLEGNGTTAGTALVFGQAFRPGDLPRDRAIHARTTAGQALRAQADVKTRHPDGSARFAVLSLAAPPLRRGEKLGVVLAARPPEAAPALDLARLAAPRRPLVEIAPPQGAPWQADLAALLAGLRGGPAIWQAGPLAAQARIAAWVPPAACGGATSLRLVVDLAARADGSLWLDVWLRNDATMRPGGGDAAYSLRVLVDGREALRAEGLRHRLYTAWGRQLRVLAGASAPAPPYPRQDAGYLAEAGAIARYDLSLGVEEAVLSRYAALLAAPDWAPPFGSRGIAQRMGATGNRPDIGPTTEYQAAWLISGDRRAAAVSIGQAEAAGSIPWHHWDPEGGADGQGGWLEQRRWPRLWTDPRGGRPPGGLLQPVPADTGWQTDAAHQPALGFIPFLLTGRRSALDALQAQAAWNVIGIWPGARRAPGDPGDGAIILQNRQVRGAAWGMRELDQAAWIAPEDDPQQGYFRWLADRNWAWLRARLPALTAEQGEAHGRLPGEYGAPGNMAPWQQDYFTTSAAAAARRGNPDALAVLRWMENFLAGRFLAAGQGFPPHDGVAYNLADSSLGPGARALRSWAEIGEASRARGLSNGEGWRQSEGYYGRLGLASLALLMETLGSARAAAAYAWLKAAGAPFTDATAFARTPTLSIVPRGQPLSPRDVPRCEG
ncbi:hypothetical protein [Siccirubricoccus phaeus]|uniref:hypothetical protein n=1 Tax=Siccirubricoccus phaeus TaxID=2595053 RepID=UPI0011F400B6|nr:hypothetical protein [Siccirubricoccus phaeus]